jgi:hypothetical protein
VRFFSPNVYCNTSLYGSILNFAASPYNRHIVASFKLLTTDFTKLNVAKKLEWALMAYGPYEIL